MKGGSKPMVEPTWPTAVRRQRLIESSRTERDDGYDFTQTLGIEQENGVETVWRTSGSVFKRRWGSEQVMDLTVTNMPPHMQLGDIPLRIERKIKRVGRRGDRYECTFEVKSTFADGSVETTKDTAILDQDVDELVNIPHSETVAGIQGAFENSQSLTQFKPGKRLNTSRPEEE